MELLRALVAEYWETLYPEIEDGDLELRAAPLDWVGAYLENGVRKTGITKSGLGFYKYKESRSVGYEEQATESDAKRAARETAVAEGKITAEEFDAAVQNTPTTLYETWVGSLDESLATLETLNEFCKEKFGEYTPGFAKLRIALEDVRQVVNSLWQRKLAAPSAETRLQIERLAVDSNWAELIETAETAMAEPCGRVWLDLQRYVVKACEEYGYPAIATAIRAELKSLLKDIPKLTEWTLADDTPTANGETQTWIREFSQPEWTASMPIGSTETEAADVPDGYDQAMEQVHAGRPGEAIEMLAKDISLQVSGRARFQRKLQLAQLCMATGHEALAHPILEHLVEEIDRHELEGWESADMVAHALSLLYRSNEKLNGDPALKQKIYARICRLDPIQALACGG